MMTRLEPGTVLDGIDRDGAARLIVGTAWKRQTEFALSVLMAGLRRYGGTQAVMAVSGRVAADALGNRVIRELGFPCRPGRSPRWVPWHSGPYRFARGNWIAVASIAERCGTGCFAASSHGRASAPCRSGR